MEENTPECWSKEGADMDARHHRLVLQRMLKLAAEKAKIREGGIVLGA